MTDVYVYSINLEVIVMREMRIFNLSTVNLGTLHADNYKKRRLSIKNINTQQSNYVNEKKTRHEKEEV